MAKPMPKHPNLKGNFAPIGMECDAPDLIVHGQIPAELRGTYYRNGPDPQFAPRGQHHWFAGDGMIHAFHIEDGRCAYLNRWVRTKKWELEHAAHESLFAPFDPASADPSVAGVDSTLANTNIVWHGGRLLALEEGHAPFELDPVTLASKGEWTFDDALVGPMTAHPKLDPETGEMLFFGYMADGPFTPGIRYHVVGADGKLTRSDHFEAPYASMVHDFVTTAEHVLFPIFPLTGSLERAMVGAPPFAWEPEKGTHIGIMGRDEDCSALRWFEHDPCYVFHPMNAWTEGAKVFADVMKYEQAPLFPNPDGSPGDPDKSEAKLVRWEFDLAADSSAVKETQLDDMSGEFPRLDERRTGLSYRHGYYGCAEPGRRLPAFDTIGHVDHATGARRFRRFDAGDGVSEPIFVPRRPDAPEGDGFLLTLVYRAAENRSDLLILDAQAIDAEPLARIEIPVRVPYGFHGNWRSATA
ncbi:MAG: carotenoid oxygenase family protein [Pseudomonadales bacterium]|jgi:carotenoid cleavage dioxygenase|nr:carotenoid oxygenase family protein [Pseudomonadales bacterium]